MKRFRNLTVGTIVAAFAPALLAIAYGLAAATSVPQTPNDWIGVGLLFALVSAFSLAGFVLLGLPYVLLLRRRGWLNWPAVLCGSAAAGTVFFAAVATLLAWNHQPPNVEELWPGVVLGLASGIGFCLGARPSLDHCFASASQRDCLLRATCSDLQ